MKFSDGISDKEFRRIMRREFGHTVGNMVIGAIDRLDASNEQARRRNELRERDIELSNFQACQECPKCRTRKYHLMQSGIDKHGYVVRVCGECQHCWRQK